MIESEISRRPRVYVLTSHPATDSLTAAICEAVVTMVDDAGGVAELHNLHTSDFEPRYSEDDITAYRARLDGHTVPPAEDIQREQQRIENSELLVLVFPVYWWSMPAHMKGWVDRVFTGGWSWGMRHGVASAVSNTDVHVVAITGTTEERFTRHGYLAAMRTQIDHGILEYNQFRSSTWTWVWDPRDAVRAEIDQVVAAVQTTVLRPSQI